MPEIVKVSTVENSLKLMGVIEEYFKNNRFAEITQAIGIHSVLIDPQRAISNQATSYRAVLNMLKNRISVKLGKKYGEWYAEFPKIMDQLVSAGQNPVDQSVKSMLSSHFNGFSSFKSVDGFFFWSLEDRRLPLDQIVKLIEKTTQKYA